MRDVLACVADRSVAAAEGAEREAAWAALRRKIVSAGSGAIALDQPTVRALCAEALETKLVGSSTRLAELVGDTVSEGVLGSSSRPPPPTPHATHTLSHTHST